MINGTTQSRDKILMSALVALEAAHAYSAVLPSIFTIRTFGGEPGTVKAIRDGEVFGTCFGLGIASVVGMLIKSWMPVIFAAATSALMISVYEGALKTRNGYRVDLPVYAPVEVIR